jgi:hypothetical protein
MMVSPQAGETVGKILVEIGKALGKAIVAGVGLELARAATGQVKRAVGAKEARTASADNAGDKAGDKAGDTEAGQTKKADPVPARETSELERVRRENEALRQELEALKRESDAHRSR